MHRKELCGEIVQRLVRYPKPHDSHYGVVPPPPPKSALDLRPLKGRHDRAARALVQVETYSRSLGDPFLVSRILTRQEAVRSSAIEGTNSTLDELLASENTSDEETSAATRQVHNYALALDRFVGTAAVQGPKFFSVACIQRLHRRVMLHDPEYRDQPGELRTRTVWIGGGRDIAYSTFNPPPADRVHAALDEVVAYLRDEEVQSFDQSLFTRMAVSHAAFEAVHPFRDGNGRVGRLLLPLMMAADGRAALYISGYIEANKTAYVSALKAAQQRLDWVHMVGFVCDAIAGSAEELMCTRQALHTLQQVWRERRKFRAGSSALRTLDLLPHYPVLTVSRLADKLDVTFAAAAKAVEQLEEVGILRERTGYARNRIFRAHEALSLMNRPFGADPVVPST